MKDVIQIITMMKTPFSILFALLVTLFIIACTSNQYRNLDTKSDFMQAYLDSSEVIHIETADGKITPIILTGYVDKTMIGINQEEGQDVEIDVYDIQVIYTDDGNIYPASTEPVAQTAGAIGEAILHLILIVGMIAIIVVI